MLRAGNWEWYYPDEGDDSIASIVGYSKPSVSGLMRHSTAMARDAAAILEMHRDAGDSEIGVVHMGGAEHGHRPDLDSVVYLVDTHDGKGRNNQWRSVQSIEFGHYTKPREHEGEGPRTKRDHKRHWVPGIAPLQTAAKRAVRKRRLSI